MAPHPAGHDGAEAPVAWKQGDRVEAIFQDGDWYPASIQVANGAGSYIIRWDDGDDADRVKSTYELRPLRSHSIDGVGSERNWELVGEAVSLGRVWAGWALGGVTSVGRDLLKTTSGGGKAVWNTCLDENDCGDAGKKRTPERTESQECSASTSSTAGA